MYFNDSTSIILSSDETKFDYLAGVDSSPVSGLVDSYPPELDKKVKLAVKYKGYMSDNLHGTSERDEQFENQGRPKIFLADFRRASNAVLFRMSNNVIQVFFLLLQF